MRRGHGTGQGRQTVKRRRFVTWAVAGHVGQVLVDARQPLVYAAGGWADLRLGITRPARGNQGAEGMIAMGPRAWLSTCWMEPTPGSPEAVCRCPGPGAMTRDSTGATDRPEGQAAGNTNRPMEVNMASTDVSVNTSTKMPEMGTIDMKLEVVTLPVSDVDRAKRFYQSLGWRTDADIVAGDAFRVVQLRLPTRGARSHSGRASPQRRLAPPGACCWPSRTSTRRVKTSSVVASRSARCSTTPRGVFLARTRSIAPTRPMLRSAIQMAMSGSSRRSRRGFRGGSGRTDDGHRFAGRPAP